MTCACIREAILVGCVQDGDQADSVGTQKQSEGKGRKGKTGKAKHKETPNFGHRHR